MVHLLAASVPRLELMGAVLGLRLALPIANFLKIDESLLILEGHHACAVVDVKTKPQFQTIRSESDETNTCFKQS